MNNSDALNERVAREREWHDARFSDEDTRGGASRFYVALKDWYLDYNDFCVNSASCSALEVGAGLETLAIDNELQFQLTSIDISSKAIDSLKAKKLSGHLHFEVADAHKLPFGDNCFDLLLARGVLHHLDLDIALCELQRVLDVPHKIIFGEPLNGNPLIRLYRLLTPHLRAPDEHPLSGTDIHKVMSSFPDATITYYGFFTLIVSILTNRSSNRAKWLDDILLNSLKLGPFLAWACIIKN